MPIDESSSRDDRARVRSQVDQLVEAHGERVGWDSDEPEEFRYLFDPDAILVQPGSEDAVRDALRASDGFRDDIGDLVDVEEGRPDDQRLGLLRLTLPTRTDDDPRRVPLAMDVLDAAFDFVDQREPPQGGFPYAPDHWIHVAPGSTKLCPESEPEETGVRSPWPPMADDLGLGSGVRVSVVDTGWHAPAARYTRTRWLAQGVDGDAEDNSRALRQYAGHGTFIAGIVKCLAPAAEVRVERFLRAGGALLESEMVLQLQDAIRDFDPHVINLSAGATTRLDRPLFCFERFYARDLEPRGARCLLVAAAGNDGVADPFWPASFEWALGVGSLDRSGTISSFSNFGSSADVYTLGRNIINAFPKGTYVCQEPPDAGDVRRFRNGLARWSGTSFAAPIVAGLIAARMTGEKLTAHEARDAVLKSVKPINGVVAQSQVDALLGPPFPT